MNVLILGLGSIGRRHAQILRALQKDATIYALRSGKGESMEGVANISTLDGASSMDLAIIATPTFLHPASVMQVLSLHPFLFLEKPLALSVEDGIAIVRAAEQAGIGTYVGCHLRFHPCLLWLREHLPIDRVRSVHVTCTSWLPDWQPSRDYKKSFRADASKSGGVHLELIHEMDYVRWLFGDPLKKSLELRSTPALGIEAPGEARYHLTYADFTAEINLSYASHDRKRACVVEMNNGQWTVDLLAFTVSDEKGKMLFQGDSSLDAVYEAQMRHVLDCVEGKAASVHPVQDALKTLTLALP